MATGDAIVTLGENAFGSESVFLNNIQVTLKELGVERTLTDCLGSGIAFSARDLCALGTAAVKSEHFCRWSAQYMEHIVHAGGRETELVNANRMIRSYSGCFGLMTGSQKEEGYTGVFAVKRQEVVYVAAIIGAKSSEERFVAEGTGSFIFTNLVDFDMLYGHRRDVEGYARALERFDEQLPDIMNLMKDEDILMITADHGCDPAHHGTDHTREHIPLLVWGKPVKGGVDLGVRRSFADIAATIYDYLTGTPWHAGTSFMKDILK